MKNLLTKLFNLFFDSKRPSSLPSNKELAKKMAEASDSYPRYFGAGFYHRWWLSREHRRGECGYCEPTGFGWLGLFCGAILSLCVHPGWMVVSIPLAINYGLPLVDTWRKRRATYGQCLETLNDSPRERQRQLLSIVRQRTINGFNYDISQLEAGLGPLKRSESEYLKHKERYANTEIPVSNREALLKEIDDRLAENRRSQADLLERIGDKRAVKDLVICKFGDIEAAIALGDTLSGANVSSVRADQSADALNAVNDLAIEVGTSALAVPELSATAEDMVVPSLVEAEERRRVGVKL